ncbi:putative DNA modification/repair radical SAM protein [Bengtsoniella intestinalis]|uniref:putative DNA modification/repair radical SAM protein n=1 Tax=Bengtsoniella intestinalis TaxID=3073143 RepID=UPI00391F9FE7
MDILEKLTILSDAAKYDAACTSSGSNRGFRKGHIGSTSSTMSGCCHSFSADGRCISLLKVLMSNACSYDCVYCVNRCTNQTPRATFTPQELADLTIGFYRRNYIEGLFLSSGVMGTPDYTTELMIKALHILRHDYRFNGYIHAKAIPGTSPYLIEQLGYLSDRISVNIELPSQAGLQALAPKKTKAGILAPMGQIHQRLGENKQELALYRHAPTFAPAGQSTQMIVGATPESDLQILRLTQSLYQRYSLKRVFYSAYIPVVEDTLLPSKETKPPLLREHRLYQADWLLRFYGFRAEELLDENNPSFHPSLDPKCNWALAHLDFFPVEVNSADYETLLRIPGVGTVSAQRIIRCRRQGRLQIDDLKKLGVVMNRAQYFLTACGKMLAGLRFTPEGMAQHLMQLEQRALPQPQLEQLSLFPPTQPTLQ